MRYNFNISDIDEICPEFWNTIVLKAEDVLNYFMNDSIIASITYYGKNNDDKWKDELWKNYESLIDCLSKLLLTNDYNVLQDYSQFINETSEILTFFEDVLRNLLLNSKDNI